MPIIEMTSGSDVDYHLIDYLENVNVSGPVSLVSFSDFHDEYYYEDYRYLFGKMLCENRLPLGKLERFRGRLMVDHIVFKKTRFLRLSEKTFEFYPVIEVFFNVYIDGEYFTRSEWYEVPGKYDIDGGSWMYQAVRVYNYRKAPDNNMSDYLVPYIKNYDEEAEDILRKYLPETLKKPQYIDAEALAAAMDYEIQYVRLSENGSIEGKLAFKDAEVRCFDSLGKLQEIHVDRSTIFIDKDACRKHRKDVRSVIVHECLHGEEHSFFFALQREYYDVLNTVMAFSIEDFFMNYKGHECIKMMENQAARLTARILMPASTTRKIIELCLKKFKPYDSFLQLESTIKFLSHFFAVSVEMAKNRMIELGYKQARGVLNCVDNRYVPGYIVDDVFWNKTYTIPVMKLFKETERNKELEKLILSGQYIYIEGHLCRRDDKYIWKKNNVPMLSPYARNHMSECCVLFTVRHNNEDYEYIPGTLNMAVQDNDSDFLFSAKEYTDMYKQEENFRNESAKVPEDFYEAFVYYKQKGKLTYFSIADLTTMEKSKIERITKKDPAQRQEHTFEDAMALAVSICPSPQLAEDFLEKSGYNMNKTVQRRFYRNLIYKLFGAGIEEYNFALSSVGLPLLVENEDMSCEMKNC